MASVEVCDSVGIDRSTLSRYVTLGRITPAMRLPGRTGAMLFSPTDVEALKDWYYGERLVQRPTEAAS
jgi:predicted site-specific integrase-resolvase